MGDQAGAVVGAYTHPKSRVLAVHAVVIVVVTPVLIPRCLVILIIVDVIIVVLVLKLVVVVVVVDVSAQNVVVILHCAFDVVLLDVLFIASSCVLAVWLAHAKARAISHDMLSSELI